MGLQDDGAKHLAKLHKVADVICFYDFLNQGESVSRSDELNELIEALEEATKGSYDVVAAKIDASLKHESDRGCVIFGAALVDESLEDLLRAHFRQAPDDAKLINSLFQRYAPLATFSGKLQIAYAFGIVPRRLRDMIELVRRLRNDFAHESGPLGFSDSRCRDRLELLFKLSLEEPSLKKVIDKHDQIKISSATLKTNTDATRAFFTMVLVFILGFLQSFAVFGKAGVDIRERGRKVVKK